MSRAPALGRPYITELASSIRVTQRRQIAWVLLAFSPGLPLLVWLASGEPVSAAVAGMRNLNGFAFFAGTLLGLVLVVLSAYGIFWLFWLRDLVIDKASSRYTFRSGVWPWLTCYQGNCDEPLMLHILRQAIGGMGSQGDPGSMSGDDRVHWQLKLDLPGCEPLWLGDFCERTDALADGARWRTVFPHLVIVDNDRS